MKGHQVKIVAELAQGFEGKPVQASLLVRAAARSGADAVKLQMVFADELATADYKHYALFHSLEMSNEVWIDLAEEARRQGTELQADIFGRRSLALAERAGISTVKLHGTDIANPRLLGDVAKSSIPEVMLGAGGALLSEIESARAMLANKKVVILLGFQSYPTPTEGNQIDRVRYLREKYRHDDRVAIGFADHAEPSTALRVSLAAAAIGAGASVIEKHLTLGRNMELEDFESALSPDEFADFVVTLRGVAAAIGTTERTDDFGMSEAEKGYRRMIRRHVVAARDLPSGATLTAGDVLLKRTAADDPILDVTAVVGRTMKQALSVDSAITEGALNAHG